MVAFMMLAGLLLGGLINLLADSLPTARRVTTPRCQACTAPREPLAWLALPGWIAGHGRCPYCGSHRPARAVLAEIAAALGTGWLYLTQPTAGAFLQSLLISAVFLLILIIDIEHRLILHVVSLPSALLIGLLNSLNADLGLKRTLLGGAVGFFTFFLLYLAGVIFGRWIARRRSDAPEEEAFGFGDVMLAMVIGVTVGFPGVIEALIRGILAAGIFSLAYLAIMALRRRYEAFSPIPYGPFLILGGWWVYFQGWSTLESLLGMG